MSSSQNELEFCAGKLTRKKVCGRIDGRDNVLGGFAELERSHLLAWNGVGSEVHFERIS